jgi:hypothetical protein
MGECGLSVQNRLIFQNGHYDIISISFKQNKTRSLCKGNMTASWIFLKNKKI